MDDDFQIYFVKPDKNNENSATLIEAFETLQKSVFNLKPEWISQDDCLQVTSRGKHIYIFDPFEGKGYDNIYSLGLRIYGPRCLLANLHHGMELPRNRRQPIYNLAMKGINLCCTSVDKKTRDEIMKLAHLMGGEVSSDLTTDITHLVAGEVGSNKYLVASENGKQIMVKDWVYKVWEMSQERHVVATDDMFAKYRCPAFLGLTIVVSGFTVNEKNRMRNFIIRYGGKYSGELKMNECTHLIVKEPKGPKFEAAKSWQIRIVNENWLLDCVDKQKYLDPKVYQYNETSSKKVNTSTPERLSVSGPNINDISAITLAGSNTSMSRVDETNMTCTRMSSMFTTTGKVNNIAETRLGLTAIEDNSTLQPPDVFLDGCKIYLSGMKPSMEDKAKKVISVGGGLRALEITEGITHVVVGDVVPSQIQQILKLQERVHIVSIDWLMDCFSQNTHVNEDRYTCSDIWPAPLVGKERPSTKNKVSNDIRKDENSNINDKRSSKEFTSSMDRSGFKQDAPSDLEMAELLSQYMEPAAPTNIRKDEINSNTDKESQEKAVEKLLEDKDDETLTQDPNDANPSKGIFHGLKFIILGFAEEQAESFTNSIIENGGQVIDGYKKRQVVDIAIVPINGCPVDVTVSEILTNAWLELCIESMRLISYDGHWLNRPMELPDNNPFKGLCITVSGYHGLERNWIIGLARFLGADCQDKFSRRSNKKAMANTHLIVNEPTGSKYVAAKNWNVPAVGKEWLLKCIQCGKKVSEDEYAVEILYQQQLDSKASNDISSSETARVDRPHSTSALITPVAEKTIEDERQSKEPSPKNQTIIEADVQLALHEADLVQVKDLVPSSSGECSSPANQNMNIRNPMVEALARETNSSIPVNEKQKKIACQPSQTENITAGSLKTPASVMRQKWGVNIPYDSPTTPYGMIKGGGETPGTFMKPGFRPKFNLDGFLNTPETTEDLNKSTPLGEIFKRHISRAAQLVTAQNSTITESDLCHLPQSQHELAPLHGVVIAVAKKLGRSHCQYNSIVVELGGNYSWQIGPNVTHFVFQGRPNDTNKEFRNARDQKKVIVSPYWLFACKEQNARVDESLFPHNYNPSYSLAITPSTKSTPLRSTRTTAKNSHLSEPAPAPTPVKVPSKKMPVLNLQKVSSTDFEKSVSVCLPLVNNEEKASQKPSSSSTDATLNPINDSKEKNDELSVEEDNRTKTLLNAMANAPSRSKSTLRKKGKRINLSGQSSENSSPLTHVDAAVYPLQKSTKEPSQSLEVQWDDPTKRLEKEKLGAMLDLETQPTQNTEELLLAAVQSQQVETTSSTRVAKAEEITESKFASTKSPTPEPPPLAFPLPKRSSHVQAPEVIELLTQEPAENDSSLPIFIMSGLKNEEKLEYSALVEQLGGKCVELPHFDPSCTHLIVAQPTRNEKCLSAVASGKWVLHKSYFEACREQGKFVEESHHEWGSEYTLTLMQRMDKQSAKLAAAAHKWRKQIAAIKKTHPECRGAFDGWKVYLCLDRAKEDNFKRLLEAGGATVSTLRAPFPKVIQGTHAFIDLNKVAIPETELEKLVLADIHCLKAEFIPGYLMDSASPTEYYPEQIIALRACLSEPVINRKRLRGNGDALEKSSKIARHKI